MAEPADSKTLNVTVLSPARPVFAGEAEWVTASAVNGSFGVLPRHAPMMAALSTGPLRIGTSGGKVTRFVTHGGFLEVSANEVTILVDREVTEE